MTNDKAQMTNEIQSTKFKCQNKYKIQMKRGLNSCRYGFCILSFVICALLFEFLLSFEF